jgi:hypothetical protein
MRSHIAKHIARHISSTYLEISHLHVHQFQLLIDASICHVRTPLPAPPFVTSVPAYSTATNEELKNSELIYN